MDTQGTRFSPHGGALRGLVTALGVAALGWLVYVWQLPDPLREREAATLKKLMNEHGLLGVGLAVMLPVCMSLHSLWQSWLDDRRRRAEEEEARRQLAYPPLTPAQLMALAAAQEAPAPARQAINETATVERVRRARQPAAH